MTGARAECYANNQIAQRSDEEAKLEAPAQTLFILAGVCLIGAIVAAAFASRRRDPAPPDGDGPVGVRIRLPRMGAGKWSVGTEVGTEGFEPSLGAV